MKLFDVICLGDAIFDTFLTLPRESDHYSVVDKELRLMLGEKNLIQEFQFSTGGNACHVAIGLTRLGFSAAFAAEIGTDVFAQKIVADLESDHVVKDLLLQTPGAHSTFTVNVNIANDRVIFVHHEKRSHNIPLENFSTKWLYLTSMGDEWEEIYQRALSHAQKIRAKIAFNPGSTQLKKGAESLKNVLSVCDVLIVNKEEAEELLYGTVVADTDKETPEALLFRLNRMGPKIVVITDGENGSYCLGMDGKTYSQKVFPITVTEKTGAGDAFSTGFLAGQMSGKDIPTSLLWGTADAAGVVSKVGGHEGLLTMSELQAMLAKQLA